MNPYVESGKAAQSKLTRRHGKEHRVGEARFIERLRGFKQVINTLAVSGLVMIPLMGVMMQSAFVAAIVALVYATLLFLLEGMERRVKSDLHQFRRRKEESSPKPNKPAEVEF